MWVLWGRGELWRQTAWQAQITPAHVSSWLAEPPANVLPTAPNSSQHISYAGVSTSHTHALIAGGGVVWACSSCPQATTLASQDRHSDTHIAHYCSCLAVGMPQLVRTSMQLTPSQAPCILIRSSWRVQYRTHVCTNAMQHEQGTSSTHPQNANKAIAVHALSPSQRTHHLHHPSHTETKQTTNTTHPHTKRTPAIPAQHMLP